MTISTHAAAAKAIRTELKKNGIQARVTCKSYSGGDSVSVSINNQAPWVVAKIENFCNQYQMGHFNGMEDLYEYSNTSDLPQVKFVFVNNNYSDDVKKEAREYIESRLEIEKFSEYDLQREAFGYLNGSSQIGCFFKKPVIKYIH